MPEPRFVGVGSRLADWRRWAGFLAEHPGVRFPAAADEPEEVELRFFERFCDRPMTDADVAAYHACFDAPDGVVAGEWTARYMVDPWTVPLLARAAPSTRVIVLLSDPVMRYRIRLAYSEDHDEMRRVWSMADAVERGRFAEQLRLVFDHFPRERVLVQQQECCDADPVGEYRRLLEFVGVDPTFVPAALRRRAAGKHPQRPAARALGALGVNQRLPEGVRRRAGLPVFRPPAELWPDLEAALHDELDPEIAALTELVPDLDLSRWPSFAHLV